MFFTNAIVTRCEEKRGFVVNTFTLEQDKNENTFINKSERKIVIIIIKKTMYQIHGI